MTHPCFPTSVALLACLGSALGACKSMDAPAPVAIVVPESATQSRAYEPDGSVPRQRYVVRMSDGQRDWEVEFPEVAKGYELRIPMSDKAAAANASAGAAAMVATDPSGMTAADRELLAHLRRTQGGMEREGVFVNGESVVDSEARAQAAQDPAAPPPPGPNAAEPANAAPAANATASPPEDAPAPSRPSYFLGIEEVQKLFREGRHEIAMVHLANLERAYPNDPRLLAMKGTLWLKLGRPELARRTWEQVLQIDPANQPVLDALRQLGAD